MRIWGTEIRHHRGSEVNAKLEYVQVYLKNKIT